MINNQMLKTQFCNVSSYLMRYEMLYSDNVQAIQSSKQKQEGYYI